MKKLFILILCLIVITPLSAQKIKKGIEYKLNIEALKQAPLLVWYGWDFSNAKMRDFRKFQEGELIIGAHIPAIIAELEKLYPGERTNRVTKKDSVIVDVTSVQDLYQTMDSKTFIVPRYKEIDIDSIKAIVKNYKLPQTEGMGMVIIIEMMNAEKDLGRFVSGYITFFDITTREVYYAIRMKGLPGSKWGFNDYWVNGLTELHAYFFADYYSKLTK